MLFLALALPAMYAYAPSLEGVAKSRWLGDIGAFITKSLTPARPEANASAVDPVAAANLDEDLDYQIAQRMKSTEGWRSFLTAHPNGPHAQSARAELDKLVPPETPPAPAAMQAPDGDGPDAKIPSAVASPARPSAGSETTTPTSDEICRDDEDRLEQLSNSPTGDGVIRFLIELRCEKLRPQLLRLAERVDDQASQGGRRRRARRPFERRSRDRLFPRPLYRRRECERTNPRIGRARLSLHAAPS